MTTEQNEHTRKMRRNKIQEENVWFGKSRRL